MDINVFKEFIKQQIKQGSVPASSQVHTILEKNNHLQRWWKELNFEFLSGLLPHVEEIIFHGNGRCYTKSALEYSPLAHDLSSHELQLAFELLALRFQTQWNYTSPFASFYAFIAGKQMRVSLIHFSCSPDLQSSGFFRIHSDAVRGLIDYLEPSLEPLLLEMIASKKNVLVSGATGSGKTSFLSTVISQFKPYEHQLIIEDALELACPHPNATRLLSGEGVKKDMKSYLTYGMRMSPDRIILGELRSSEVISFLMALNTGHSGCWSTIHANGPLDAIDRLCLLFNLFSDKPLDNHYVCQLACNALDFIIHIEHKRVTQITRIINYHNGKVIHENLLKEPFI